MTARNAFGQVVGPCPDCDAEVRMVEVAPGITVAAVFHDDTCPHVHQERTRDEA